jgi:hypothetical protein
MNNVSDILNRQPPEELWAQRAINTACVILCQLYDRELDREAVFKSALKLKTDIVADRVLIDPDTGEHVAVETRLSTLQVCRDHNSEMQEESAFRRGYVHGYAAACDDVEAGKTIDLLNRHADKLNNEWRTKDLSEITPPPFIG